MDMANYHIEKEYKTMITHDAYLQMLKSLFFDKTVIQTNHYYQAGKDMGMRIRKIDDKHIFTLKHFVDGQVREYEFPLPGNSIHEPLVEKLLKELNVCDPVYLGEMTTVRSILYFSKGELCLDRSLYLGMEDYEIEYELKDPLVDDFATLASILKDFDLVYYPSQYTKYTRFKKRLEETK